MKLPYPLVLAAVKVLRFNRSFLTEDAARARIAELAVRPEPYAPPRLRTDVTISAVRRDGWPVYTLLPRSGRPVGAAVYAHGGGWIGEIAPEQWRSVAQVAAEANIAVVVPIYPLAPIGHAHEVVSTFVEITRETREAYGEALLIGDSAGGQIVLSAALQLRDEHRLVPRRTVLISPALDLTWSNPDIPKVQPTDPWLAVPGGRVRAEAWRGDLELTDPRVSPLFGDFAGLGPITVYCGTHDILNPDARLLTQKAREAGVEIDLVEAEGQIHVYPLLPTSIGAKARAAIVDTLRSAVVAR